MPDTVAFIRHSSFKNQSNLSGKVTRKPLLLSWMSVKPSTLSGIRVFLSNFIKKASTTEFGISSSTGMPPPPCSVHLNGSVSSEFPILQGVRQGAILSPLLYSIFVDELLDHLQASSASVSVNSVNCAAPMFADDLALVAASGERLQTLLDICSSYASKWRYQFNSSKSGVMVFGESSRSRSALRNSRSWILGSSSISEVDNYHHLGILRSLSNSSRPKIAERCSAGRSAFFSLNSLGSRFGCLHPITSFRLYSSLSLPILIYGSELWNLSKSDLLLISRVHRKILRTIQGLPTRCSSNALTALIGSCDISHLIQIRQLSFINSLTNMSQSDLPRQVLLARLESPSLSGAIPQ